jgi:hypothetical protein
MRKAGAPLRVIAKELGISIPSVHGTIKKAIAELEKESEQEARELRRITIERFDAMILGIWDKARTGGLLAIDRVIAIEIARHRIMGTAIPQVFEFDPGPKTSVSIEQARKKLDALIEAKSKDQTDGRAE